MPIKLYFQTGHRPSGFNLPTPVSKHHLNYRGGLILYFLLFFALSLHSIYSIWILSPKYSSVITSHQSEWPTSKSLQITNAGECVEKREPSYTLGGNVSSCSHYRIREHAFWFHPPLLSLCNFVFIVPLHDA